MKQRNNPIKKALARRDRVRAKIRGTGERPRLHVYRSNHHMWVQIIDDVKGHTLASVSTKNVNEKGTKTQKAKKVGELLATQALKKKITKLCFDRGHNRFHGRVKAIADAVRQEGIKV